MINSDLVFNCELLNLFLHGGSILIVLEHPSGNLAQVFNFLQVILTLDSYLRLQGCKGTRKVEFVFDQGAAAFFSSCKLRFKDLLSLGYEVWHLDFHIWPDYVTIRVNCLLLSIIFLSVIRVDIVVTETDQSPG